jgi:hypothetical protein
MAEQKQFFRVEGDAVHLVTERIERTVRLQDLMGEVTKESGITTPILPLGCRFYSARGECSVFVIEQAPTTRTLEWDGRRKLSFPYVIFVVVFSGSAVSTGECRVFYRTSPLGSGDDKLLRPNLCNTYQDGRICTGDVRVSGDTLAQKAESFVSAFWRSRFNWDLNHNNWEPCAQRFPQVRSLETWQAESEKNPLFPLGLSWFEHGLLQDVIEGRC